MKTNPERLIVKRRVQNLSSLEAAVCNVALFKTLKEKEFRESIFISYNEEGVVLEAQSQKDWNRASDCIHNFIKNKKVELLTYGYEREVYDDLINHQLKEYTKRLKDRDHDQPYPYINLIHSHRLRQSCEFMNKSKYNEPLKKWEERNKVTPNFAYLVVEPKERFEEVKRSILSMLKGSDTEMLNLGMQPPRFIHLFYNSQFSSQLQDLYEKKELEVSVEEDEICMTIYADLNIPEVYIKALPFSKRLLKLGYRIIKQDQIKKNLLQAKQVVKDSDIMTTLNTRYLERFGGNYCFMICLKEEETQLEKALVDLATKSNNTSIAQEINQYKVCEYSQLIIIKQLPGFSRPTSLVCINHCEFMLQEFILSTHQELENFKAYLEENERCFNSSLTRLFGITSTPQRYYLLLQYKPRSLQDLISNGGLVDQIQVCHIALQIMYTIHFLHTLPTPRCLGIADPRQIFVPHCVILPFLFNLEDYNLNNDVKVIGELLDRLLDQPSEEVEKLIEDMTASNPFDRVSVEQTITILEDMLK